MGEVARHLRPGGWLVFDLHTDQMMEFTLSNPVVAGEAAGNAFVIRSVVDAGARTCDTRIELTRARDGDPFSEQHRQYFHTDAEVAAALRDAGFAVTAVSDEYTHRPVEPATTLRATWTARRGPASSRARRLSRSFLLRRLVRRRLLRLSGAVRPALYRR